MIVLVDWRVAGCPVPKTVGTSPFLDVGVFALFARTIPRVLITHTHGINNKIQKIKAKLYVKIPVVLSKNI